MIGDGPGPNPEWFEEGLRAALLRDGRQITATFYFYNDRSLFPDDEPARDLETCYPNRSRHVETLCGQIQLTRRCYHHRPSGTGRYPLDDILGLESGCSPAVARLMCRAASQSHSYEEGAADLAAYAAIHLNACDLGRMVGTVAPSLGEALASLPVAPVVASSGPWLTATGVPTIIPILYVSADGTGVPMRREALVGRTGKQQDGTARTREAKLGCVFTQTSVDKNGDALRDPSSTSYVGTMQGCREVGILLRQEAVRRGLGRAQQVIYLGDGAAWVWENCRLNFPGAIEILDFYHASEHVGQLARALHDSNPAQAAAQQAQWCHEMKLTSPGALIAEVAALLAAHPEWCESKRSSIQSQIDYLQSHCSRTHYGEYQAKGYFIGSGIIEAGCKTVIGRRSKQSGMFWSEAGAQNLLTLRCQIIGPHFDAAWQARRIIITSKRQQARRWSPDDQSSQTQV